MVQFLGLCRFSYPALQDFQTRHADLSARRAALYAPDRLDLRMMWFEHILLPGIRGQTDKDFKLLLLLGEDFPDPWRGRMAELIRDIPQIVPVFRAPLHHRGVCRDALMAARDPAADWVAEFRLDDDDAVAVDFIARAREDFEILRPMAEQTGSGALDYQRGVLVETGPEGVELLPLVARYWAAGLCLCYPSAHEQSLMDYPHHRVWWRMPTVTRPETAMFVRGSHATNDSPINRREGITLKIPPATLRGILDKRFGIDLPAFRAAWDDLRRLGRPAPPRGGLR
ncbi:glycosyltransferase [Roseisalinus antarcticus]|uniref:Rhamnosyl transferase n=1 Tax=Roseisalinus antarcticus TaxID=254357 RepID=A0A1Y5U0J2_9RHOB|nr:glycosyltransferase [Roseisalinus antarcticus]SLN77408.1 hypothetical protein ROA7023_04392 [Roseisalinus antarcticus]